MDFYTIVTRESNGEQVALCLENGLVGQGKTKAMAIEKLKEAISSFDEACGEDTEVYNAPLSIKELHEFLSEDGKAPVSQEYALRAVYA